MQRTLPTYLRTHRKRTGLTQEEVAFLLGCKDGTKLSRYERRSREPSLKTAFACQAVFGTPAHRLFPGMYAEVEEKIKNRAQALSKQLAAGACTRTEARKREALAAIVGAGGAGLAYAI